MAAERYAFTAEWYDSLAGIVRRYNFLFYPRDNSVEMIDLKQRRVFLKRTKDESVTLEMCYVGSLLNVLGRQLKIVDYADNFTKSALSSAKEKTFAMIKPDAMDKMPLILEIIYNDGFQICDMKSVLLRREQAEEFYQEHRGKPFFSPLVSFMTEGPVVAMVLLADDGVEKWRTLIGPTNSAEARSTVPDSIRARFGTDLTHNAVHGADSPASAKREAGFFFGQSKSFQTTAKFQNPTLCLVKPHAVMKGMIGRISRAVVEGGFTVTAIQQFHLDKVNAEEFLEVYRGVVAEYGDMVTELTSGPCICMALTRNDGPSVEQFRQLVGPVDPEIARNLRPSTLRAKFGRHKIQNAVHCTDLEEDGTLEVEYFFNILQKSQL